MAIDGPRLMPFSIFHLKAPTELYICMVDAKIRAVRMLNREKHLTGTPINILTSLNFYFAPLSICILHRQFAIFRAKLLCPNPGEGAFDNTENIPSLGDS